MGHPKTNGIGNHSLQHDEGTADDARADRRVRAGDADALRRRQYCAVSDAFRVCCSFKKNYLLGIKEPNADQEHAESGMEEDSFMTNEMFYLDYLYDNLSNNV